MAKGIIYIMTTSVNGLIKIGKTDNFKQRMAILEQNGYWNVSGLHPYFAVKVSNYGEKERLIHTIFSKSRVSNSELFALDKQVAKELLESFEGEQIYPEVTKYEKELKKEPNINRKSRLILKNIGIPNGAELTYIEDSKITCEVVNNETNIVRYEGKLFSPSGLVCYLKTGEYEGHAYQGTSFFTYKGKRLTDIRKEMGV